MREIKFRIFEEKTGKVERVLAIDWFFKTAITLKDPHGVGFRDKDYLLMQYTGIKDKNGVEIYEGDIIEFLTHDRETAMAHIVFERLAFKALDTEDECYEYDFDDLTDIEVIGNIYENQELLNENT
ncbi:YopX family protein [Campylobacter majalis]|uniref:YopX family protein n=1 Tax=Campylobacter majalis TaxID=2790656 RepID=UPI003D68C5E4